MQKVDSVPHRRMRGWTTSVHVGRGLCVHRGSYRSRASELQSTWTKRLAGLAVVPRDEHLRGLMLIDVFLEECNGRVKATRALSWLPVGNHSGAAVHKEMGAVLAAAELVGPSDEAQLRRVARMRP